TRTASTAILWISNAAYRTPFRLIDGLMPIQWRDTYPYRHAIMDNLSTRVQSRLFLRPYYTAYGWDEEERSLRSRFANRDTSSDGRTAIRSSQLVLIDHCGTSLLEALCL